MRIKEFEIHWIGGRLTSSIRGHPNEDLTIFTGRNGSGKTTVLKLLWYVISGNVEHAIKEVPFISLRVKTTTYEITIKRRGNIINEIVFIKDEQVSEYNEQTDEDDEYVDLTNTANYLVKDEGSSVFFPTFRRIEGGFSLSNDFRRTSTGLSGAVFPQFTMSPRPSARGSNPLEEAMIELSRRLSVSGHTFVSAISTYDIVSLLMRQYTEISDLTNSLQNQVSQRVISTIKDHRADVASASGGADAVLEDIRQMIEGLDNQRDQILSPFNAVRALVEKLFQHKGIKLNNRLSFGDAANAVSSDALSAGEKQMLSFICYNAFYRDSIIFIDEPELSLHVDWQRQLFPILQDQGTSNQFIIATHSPFIYSKYSDKEVSINPDRGDAETL
jgi:predicted ATPase